MEREDWIKTGLVAGGAVLGLLGERVIKSKLVKKALKAGYKEGIYSDYSRDVIRPSAQECAQNGRARSTKMRWAIKSE